MQTPNQKPETVKERNEKAQNVRVTAEASELLSEILKKVNSKEHGRTVRAAEVVARALPLITAKEIKELQEASLSNADRLELSYQKYIRENTFLEKDDFIGLILESHKLGPLAERSTTKV